MPIVPQLFCVYGHREQEEIRVEDSGIALCPRYIDLTMEGRDYLTSISWTMEGRDYLQGD